MPNTTPQQSQFLSPTGLADYLDVPLATVYAWRHGGDGPPGSKVGRHVRYRLTDVDAWVEGQKAVSRNGSAT
jgi:excisionase family DNA binding protein